MTETQNVEYKELWRDEYLKWICGFANAQGGKIYIGKKDDGAVIGLKDAKRLLEEIPNKIQSKLGIVADVNLLSENGSEYIEIKVMPTSYPVNYDGEYHYRSGSTKQLLRGNALTQFLIMKTGVRWESETVNNVSADDLDKESFDIFRKNALRSGRMSKEDLDIERGDLLSRLNLMSDGKLTRAGALCFCRHAEKVVSGCYVKIGKFSGSEIIYQDEVHGSLILMADRIIDLIYLKYLKANVSYRKETRVEKYPFAREAVREAVYNALIHCNWASNNPIQIRIDEETMSIGNSCMLPYGWSEETLMNAHLSNPLNPTIADVFYRAGYIERWGRGIQKICDATKSIGANEPKYFIHSGDIMLKFNAPKDFVIKKQKRRGGSLEGSLEGLKNVKKPDTIENNQKNTKGSLEGSLEGSSDKISEDEILNLIRNDPSITRKELAIELGTTIRRVQRKVDQMRKSGRIKRLGGKRYGSWIIKD